MIKQIRFNASKEYKIPGAKSVGSKTKELPNKDDWDGCRTEGYKWIGLGWDWKSLGRAMLWAPSVLIKSYLTFGRIGSTKYTYVFTGAFPQNLFGDIWCNLLEAIFLKNIWEQQRGNVHIDANLRFYLRANAAMLPLAHALDVHCAPSFAKTPGERGIKRYSASKSTWSQSWSWCRVDSSTLLYPISLLSGCWNRVQGGDPL